MLFYRPADFPAKDYLGDIPGLVGIDRIDLHCPSPLRFLMDHIS
jgi:hypothetical protein